MYRLRLLLISAFVLALGVVPAMAQTPVPPPTASELITTGSSLLTDMGVLPIVFAGAIIGVAVFLFKRFKSGAR